MQRIVDGAGGADRRRTDEEGGSTRIDTHGPTVERRRPCGRGEESDPGQETVCRNVENAWQAVGDEGHARDGPRRGFVPEDRHRQQGQDERDIADAPSPPTRHGGQQRGGGRQDSRAQQRCDLEEVERLAKLLAEIAPQPELRGGPNHGRCYHEPGRQPDRRRPERAQRADVGLQARD